MPSLLKHKRALSKESNSLEIKDQNGGMKSIWLFSSQFEHSDDYLLILLRRFRKTMSLMDIREDEESGEIAGDTKFGREPFERKGKGLILI